MQFCLCQDCVFVSMLNQRHHTFHDDIDARSCFQGVSGQRAYKFSAASRPNTCFLVVAAPCTSKSLPTTLQINKRDVSRLHTYTISSELFLCDHANLQPAANCQPEACAPDQWRDGWRNHQRTISSEALFGEDCEASFCMALTLLAVQVSKKTNKCESFKTCACIYVLNRTCNALLLLACNDSKWCLPSLVSSSSRKVLPFQCCLLNIRTLVLFWLRHAHMRKDTRLSEYTHVHVPEKPENKATSHHLDSH